MNDYEPLKITAYLQSGIICDRYFPIDGVLYFQGMRLHYGEQHMTIPGGHSGEEPQSVQVVPIKKIDRRTDNWYYAASFAQWSQPCVEGSDHWNKRFDNPLADLVDFDGKRGRVIVEQGRYKAYHMPVYYRHALQMWWYVIGDGEQIEMLLSNVTNLGKKPAQGWGAVLRWTVEPFRHDWSVHGPNGELMRAVPDIDGPHHYGIRPSYWLARNQRRCHLPP